MRKKDSSAGGNPTISNNIFYRLISQNFERKNIDSAMISTFNSFLFNLGEAYLKKDQNVLNPESIKLTVQLIVAFQSNLADQLSRHSCKIDQVIAFFANTVKFFLNLATALNDIDRLVQSQVINVFWFLLEPKTDQMKLPPFDKKLQNLCLLLQSNDGYKTCRLNIDILIREAFSFMSPESNKDHLSNLFVVFLRHRASIEQFKTLLQKYIAQSIMTQHVNHFKKAITLFQHFGASFQDRRTNVQNLALKLLQSNSNFTFIAQINQIYSFSKLFSTQNSLKVIIKIIEKVTEKSNLNGAIIKVVEEISQLCVSDIDDLTLQKLDLKFQPFIIRIVDWIINCSLKLQGDSLQNKQKIPQFQEKQQKIIEFVKKLSKNKGDEGDTNNQELQKICNSFSKILKKFINSARVKTKLHLSLQSLSFLKSEKAANPAVRSFILDFVPSLLQQLNLSFQDKSPLIYAVILRRAELQVQKLQGNHHSILEDHFNQAYFQMQHLQSLNYHFILSYIFLKSINEKESIINLLIDQILKDLSKSGKNKNNRNLIINMSLLLRLLYPISNFLPIKFKIREILKSTQLLSQKLDVSQLFTVQSKQLGISKSYNFPVPQRCVQLHSKLNTYFGDYSKDNITLFYSLIIGISDLVEQRQGCNSSPSDLLIEIKFIRKVSFLKEVFTLLRVFIESVSEWQQKGKIKDSKISAFLLLLKLTLQLKSKVMIDSIEDGEIFIQKLSEYLIEINRQYSYNLLLAIDHFNSNRNQYKQQKFIDSLNSKNFIKFYSQGVQNEYYTHILLMRSGLRILKRCIQYRNRNIKDLNEQLKNLYLIYLLDESIIQFNLNQKIENYFNIYIHLLLLGKKIQLKQDIINIINQLKFNIEIIKLIICNNQIGIPISFKIANPINFIEIGSKAIINIFYSYQKNEIQLFRLINSIIQLQKKQNSYYFITLIQQKLHQSLPQSEISLIVKRTRIGLELSDKQKLDFLEDSNALYEILRKILEKGKLLQLVQELVQIDCYAECEKSAFILKQISKIFSVIQDRNSAVCEIIFNYIITLTQIFPGEEKLEIANFICNFFNLSVNNEEANLSNLEKNINLQCTNTQSSYKCLSCDDKRLLCLGCSLNCHKGHPVCYLSIPPQIKISRCQCRQIPNCCQYSKDINGADKAFPNSSRLKAQFPPSINHYVPSYINGPSKDFMERLKYGGHKIINAEQMMNPQSRFQYSNFLQEQQFQDPMSHRFFEAIGKDQFAPRIGSRLDRLFEREEYPPNVYSRNRPPGQINPFLREKQRILAKEDPLDIQEAEFEDQNYQSQHLKMEIQESDEIQQNTTILRKYALLPKFIDLMINFCEKKAVNGKQTANLQVWSPTFTSPTITKMMQITIKIYNAGTFHVDFRRQNPLNNVSCVLIKRNIAINNRYFIICTGTDMQVFAKDKLFMIASDGKPQNFSPIHRHSVSYEIHSIQSCPTDNSSFVATGLHNLAVFTLNNDGGIGRTSNRYNVNNLYINKIKLTKMGIFVGVEKQIRVISYACKPLLIIKAQQANTLIRQWSIYQKSAGCQVYFVCPNGNIFFTEILNSDEGKKQFTGRVVDQRKSKNSTGASVFIKDLPDIGKYLFASFKDGYNILGHLEGDQMENMVDLRLKGIKVDKNIFDSFFIIGHVDIVKLPQIDEVFVVCTVKKYFPPQMAFHQGYLAVIRLKKEGNTQIQILNEQATCEYFQVFYLGTRHFIILSIHTDGSLHLNSPTKIPRPVVQQEIKRIKQSEANISGISAQLQSDTIDKVKKVLQKRIKFDDMKLNGICSSYFFRENTDGLKIGADYLIVKHSQIQFQVKQIVFSKIITGISVPNFGTVQLPTRTVSSVFEVGFTNTQALYFFSQGGFRFKYTKDEGQKYVRQSINIANNRILEKLQRMQRLSEYSEHERINPSMMTNFLNIKQDANQQFILVGRSFQNFKSKIIRFDKIFNIQQDQQSSSIEKTALIIKMFLTKGLKQGNICDQKFIINLVNSIRSIIAEVDQKLFRLLKEIIIIAIQVYEKQIGRNLNLRNDQMYGLKIASQSRLEKFYAHLKLDISDEQFNQLLELLSEIIDQDLELFTYYIAKYTGLLSQIHRRLKKVDTLQRASLMVKIYALAYPILTYCKVPCTWIPQSIIQIIYAFVENIEPRKSLYDGLVTSQYLTLEKDLKNLGNKDTQVEVLDIKNIEQGFIEQEQKDPLNEIFQMFGRGQIDEETMMRMMQDASKIQYEKGQEIAQKPPESNDMMEPELQLEMQQEVDQTNYGLILIESLIEECTQTFEGDLTIILSRIVTLYVVAKTIDKHFSTYYSKLMERIYRLVAEIDLKSENDKLIAVLSYSCLFSRIITTSQTIKTNGYKQYLPYKKIQVEVNKKLQQVKFENVIKIKTPINLLSRIFKGEKPPPQAHIAYALTNLLLFPCEPTHVLLSLECYWLLPNSRQSYAHKKCESSIRDGIDSGNMQKIYQIAKQNPKIWQQSEEHLQFIHKWIDEKQPKWQLALQLLAIYYADSS